MKRDIAKHGRESKSNKGADPVSAPQQDDNHGEGNPEAAARFNKAEQAFVRSKRGQQKIQQAGDLSAEEVERMDQAARVGKSRAKTAVPKDKARA